MFLYNFGTRLYTKTSEKNVGISFVVNPPGPCGLSRLSSLPSLSSFGRKVYLSINFSPGDARPILCFVFFAPAPFTKSYKTRSEGLQNTQNTISHDRTPASQPRQASQPPAAFPALPASPSSPNPSNGSPVKGSRQYPLSIIPC